MEGRYKNQFCYETRWTFFRVKLVFEFAFEISWSSGPFDPETFGLLDFRTLGPLPSSTTSTYLFLLHYPTAFYLFLPPNSFYFLLNPSTSFYVFLYLLLPPGMVWFGLIWVRWLWSFLSLGPLPSSTTSTYIFLLHYPTSFYLFLPAPSLLTPFTSFYILLLLSTSFYLLFPPGLVWGGC